MIHGIAARSCGDLPYIASSRSALVRFHQATFPLTAVREEMYKRPAFNSNSDRLAALNGPKLGNLGTCPAPLPEACFTETARKPEKPILESPSDGVAC
jgi:hypothetical protein